MSSDTTEEISPEPASPESKSVQNGELSLEGFQKRKRADEEEPPLTLEIINAKIREHLHQHGLDSSSDAGKRETIKVRNRLTALKHRQETRRQHNNMQSEITQLKKKLADVMSEKDHLTAATALFNFGVPDAIAKGILGDEESAALRSENARLKEENSSLLIKQRATDEAVDRLNREKALLTRQLEDARKYMAKAASASAPTPSKVSTNNDTETPQQQCASGIEYKELLRKYNEVKAEKISQFEENSRFISLLQDENRQLRDRSLSLMRELQRYEK